MVRGKLFYILSFSYVLLAHGQEKKEVAGITMSEKVEFYDLTDALKKPENVTSLKLNRQGMQALTADIGKFTNLTELDLSDNDLTELPGTISSLSKLEVLNLSGNQLNTIPENICSLKSLKTLNLSSNKITSGSLSCFTGLERIYLYNNSLTAIPAGITDMQTLKALYLHSNQLTELPEKFAKMPHLEALFIQFNKIPEEPNVYKATGILNYIFNPQSLNTRQLYKYFYNQPTYTIQDVSADDLANNNEVFQASAPEPVRPVLNKWERMKAYVSWNYQIGSGSHKDIRKDELRDRLVRGSRKFMGYHVEFGMKEFAVGFYLSESQFDFYNYDSNDKFIGEATRSVMKSGLYFKQFLAPLSAKLRPYAKVGAGFNIDGGDNYGVINLQARVGAEIYLVRMFGFNVETGIGAGNIFSVGTIFRIPFGRRR